MHFRHLLLTGICLLNICLGIFAHAQKPLSSQLSVLTENDNYAFTFSDHYYTNGLMLRYVQAVPYKQGKPTRLFTAELGHQIFTPYKFNSDYQQYLDRPFTGFFYLKGVSTRFFRDGSTLQVGGLVGTVGEKAFGKEVQRWHHRNFGLKFPYGWETQLKTAVGINAEGRYIYPLLQKGSEHFGMHLQGSAHAKLGNLFVQAGAGLLLRAGAVQSAMNSEAFDARMLAPKKTIEWYLYYEPQLTVQGHNATLQGGLWQHVDNVYSTAPKPWVIQQRVGFVFAPRRWTVHLAYTHKGKEGADMRARENWGSIGVGFRW